ncbi:MAG: hypothetical protein JNM14_14385 [Ferruginibacter sp.]|nr:hypothetical protein [Ferruginibacter sp.]
MKLFKLIIALAFVPAVTQAQTIQLKLPKGAKYEIATTTRVNSSASVMGQEMESALDNSVVESIEVKDARAAETDIVSIITRITANIQAMGQEMAYNSDKKDNEGALTETFDKLKGRVKNITIDANGKIVKEDKPAEEISAGAMGMSVGAGGLPGFNSIFTGREAKAGTTWYDSTKNVAEKLTTSTAGNYTVQSVSDGTAIISFAGTQTSTGTIEQMGMEMGMTTSSKVTSQFEVDIATGLIKKSSVTTDGNSTIEAGGMSIPATIKSTITSSARQL